MTRWVDTDSSWWIYPQLETTIKIESDGVHGSKREVHEVTVTHDSGTSVAVETRPVREWERTNAISRALEWKK